MRQRGDRSGLRLMAAEGWQDIGWAGQGILGRLAQCLLDGRVQVLGSLFGILTTYDEPND